MPSLAMSLENVISGKTFDASVLREVKRHATTTEQLQSIDRYLSGAAGTQDWRELQDLVISIRMKELSESRPLSV